MEIAIGGEAWGRDEVVASFDERFARLRPRLVAVCTAVIGPDDAADLVQETYIRATERLHQLRDPGLLDAWVVRIALNEAKTVLRRRRTERRVLAVPTPSPGPDVGLRELVQRLEPRERAVVVLHYGYGYRMREIARLLDLTEINVRTIAHRARRALRAQLEEKDR